ncbi:MAG TPA: efflux RND transporter periplasmic adaptor subunit, partial [Bryobacteraceae bacterium]|nr:efflux RND transporter periplasmic adaptor subunit [Bryobacteraceae bacterium]
MRQSEPNAPTPPVDVPESVEERLRRENEELRERLRRLENSVHGEISPAPLKLWRPSRLTITAICLTGLVLVVIAFLAGFLPFQKRSALIAKEAQDAAEALPRVEVIKVTRSARKTGLDLPGNIQAMTEAPVLARADGYIKQRMADIGDKVRAGQPLAVIETPELDEQVRQAGATLQQARSSVAQAEANLRQGRSDLEFAKVTAKRWEHLVSDGSVSVQENDQYQAQYRSKVAEVQSLEQALDVQRNGVAVAQANLARFEKMKSYQVVTAPFNGVITLRNVDSGALVNNGATLLFRIAQTATLRTYVNVPQAYADSVHRGDPAVLTVSNLPGRQFAGTVARTADALDPASRTLLAEVHVPNREGLLLPGMYAHVELTSSRVDPPLLIPSDA